MPGRVPAARLIPEKDAGLQLSSFVFDVAGLSGEEHLTMRLKVLVRMLEKELQDAPDARDFSLRGSGWQYQHLVQDSKAGPYILKRGRLAPGLGIDWMYAGRTPESASGFGTLQTIGPGSQYFQRVFPFHDRHWQNAWMGRNDGDTARIAAAPTRMVFLRHWPSVRCGPQPCGGICGAGCWSARRSGSCWRRSQHGCRCRIRAQRSCILPWQLPVNQWHRMRGRSVCSIFAACRRIWMRRPDMTASALAG